MKTRRQTADSIPAMPGGENRHAAVPAPPLGHWTGSLPAVVARTEPVFPPLVPYLPAERPLDLREWHVHLRPRGHLWMKPRLCTVKSSEECFRSSASRFSFELFFLLFKVLDSSPHPGNGGFIIVQEKSQGAFKAPTRKKINCLSG